MALNFVQENHTQSFAVKGHKNTLKVNYPNLVIQSDRIRLKFYFPF